MVKTLGGQGIDEGGWEDAGLSQARTNGYVLITLGH